VRDQVLVKSRLFNGALSSSVSAPFPHLVFPHRSSIFCAVSFRFVLVDSIKRSVKKNSFTRSDFCVYCRRICLPLRSDLAVLHFPDVSSVLAAACVI
jgi:hypothetical protein